MKRALTLVIACLLLASFCVMASAEETVASKSYSATKTSAAITIDGVMDAAYNDAEVVKFDQKYLKTEEAIDLDKIADAEMRLLWDASALYAFITVKDATYAPSFDGKWYDNCDSVWLGYAKDNNTLKDNEWFCYAFPRSGGTVVKMDSSAPDVEFATKEWKGGQQVSMTPYASPGENYPAGISKPSGEVDSYTLEIKIPFTGAAKDGIVYLGAFICDDINFQDAEIATNGLVEGRNRTSTAVDRSPNGADNGIWQAPGLLYDFDLEAKDYYDKVTFVEKADTGTETTAAGSNETQGGNKSPDTGVVSVLFLLPAAAISAGTLVIAKKKSTK